MKPKIEFSAKFKRNYVTFFAVFFFFAIVVGEIVLAIAIPAYIQRENSMAFEVRKLKLLESFDYARRVCGTLPDNDDIFTMEKKIIADTLDNMAIYFNREKDDLTPDDVEKLTVVVNQLSRIVLQMKSRNGKPFSETARLDTSVWVNKLLQNNVSNSKK